MGRGYLLLVHFLFFCLFHDGSNVNVFYMAPFFSGGGYGSESLTNAMSMFSFIPSDEINLQIYHHGDVLNERFITTLPEELMQNITLMYENKKFYPNRIISEPVVVICHSEPGAWDPPLYKTLECPINEARFGGYLSGKENIYTIGRTMFETNSIPDGWIERLNRMNEVWVPTKFHWDIFAANGVEEDKLVVIPEAVDTVFYNPKNESIKPIYQKKSENETVFISVFKMERRKNWKMLLEAYFTEFDYYSDNTMLMMLISPFHMETRVSEEVLGFIQRNGKIDNSRTLPRYKILTNIPHEAMLSFYKSGDVFVLPTRGEGWGRPFVEAMSMEVPPIATNWSGPTEYITPENSFPLRINGLRDVPHDMPWKGHQWASPSLSHLKELMRFCHDNHEEVERRGKRARETMVKKFSVPKLGAIFRKNFQRIEEKLKKLMKDEL